MYGEHMVSKPPVQARACPMGVAVLPAEAWPGIHAVHQVRSTLILFAVRVIKSEFQEYAVLPIKPITTSTMSAVRQRVELVVLIAVRPITLRYLVFAAHPRQPIITSMVSACSHVLVQ